MNFILRTLRLLGVVTWVGGLIFFAFVEAPTAFHVMGTNRQFAQLINGSITTLNRLRHAAGLIFVLATIVLWRRSSSPSRRPLLVQFLMVVLKTTASSSVPPRTNPATELAR